MQSEHTNLETELTLSFCTTQWLGTEGVKLEVLGHCVYLGVEGGEFWLIQ